MATDVKVTVSLDANLVAEIDAECRRRRLSRSAAIEEALRSWRRVEAYRALAEGYARDSEENRREAELWLPLVAEAIHVQDQAEQGRPSGGRVADRPARYGQRTSRTPARRRSSE